MTHIRTDTLSATTRLMWRKACGRFSTFVLELSSTESREHAPTQLVGVNQKSMDWLLAAASLDLVNATMSLGVGRVGAGVSIELL